MNPHQFLKDSKDYLSQFKTTDNLQLFPNENAIPKRLDKSDFDKNIKEKFYKANQQAKENFEQKETFEEIDINAQHEQNKKDAKDPKKWLTK
ncbi:MAG: hypothetical protein ISN64_00275 [Rickettsia sp.]|nr:hypothetical protein [Rickettsia sp.]